jgi:hypothetical protein
MREQPLALGAVTVTPVIPSGFGRGWVGAKHWRAPNPASGALFPFHLTDAPAQQEVTLKITDWQGTEVTTVRVKARAGYNEGRWNLARSGGGRGGARLVPAGTYRVTLKVGEQTEYKDFDVLPTDLSPARGSPMESKEDEHEFL